MKTIQTLSFRTISLTVALAFAAVTARADVEDKISKSFQVEPGGQLVINADRGSIEVKTSDASTVQVEITRKAKGSDSKAKGVLKDHIVTTTQDANKVDVHAEYKGPKTLGWFSSPEIQVSYVVTVPSKFNVNLRTAGGQIGVTALAGTVNANTSGGSLKFTKIEGAVSAHTSGGSITVATCTGKVDIHTSGGSLKLTGITGDVTAKTSGGSIEASAVTGKTFLKTSGGSIDIAGLKGSIEADTSGGSISAELLEQPTGECSLKTSGGSITIALNEKAAVDVDLHTSAGRVSTDLPVSAVIKGEQEKGVLRGKVNGGGPLVYAKTSAGSVRLKRKG